jgi:hypothetical protein
MLERNTPKSGELTEKYRLYYLEKISPIIQNYEPNVKKRIYSKFYLEIAKTYFLCKEYKPCILYAKRTNDWKAVITMVVRETIKPVAKRILGKVRSGNRKEGGQS